MDTLLAAILVAEAKPGKELEMQQAFSTVVDQSKKEAGCLAYRIHVDVANPAKVLLYGIWDDEQAHDRHAEREYIQQLVRRLSVDDLLVKPFVVYFLGMVSQNEKEVAAHSFPHVVFVRLVAKPGKEDRLQKELVKVAALSAQEQACREYHVLRDVENSAAFMLYEGWQSAQLHQLQFSKQYILDFVAFLEGEDVLAQPWCSVFGREISK